jgi:hypothetical protein
MQLRKGDKVSVTGTVTFYQNGDDSIFVKIDGSHEDLWIAPSVVNLVQQMFEVGDRVCWGAPAMNGEIIAICDEHAWIDLGGGDYCTRHFDSITRLPEAAVE